MRLELDVSAYVTEQDPDESVHVADDGVSVPVELLVVKVTWPEGDDPVTLAEHVVNLPTFTDDGAHETDTELEDLLFSEVEPVLPALPRSPG